MEKPEYEIMSFQKQEEFRKWLHKNHTNAPGIWIKLYKKATGIETVTHDTALDEALCYGWIDGQVKAGDDMYWLQKFTPRRKRSMWSKRNIEHIVRLTKEGKMQPAGLKEVEEAKADGRWEQAYDAPSEMKIPEDFMKELRKNKKALAFFETLNKSNTFAIGFRLQTAKKPETRERRMKVILDMLAEGKKFH